MMIDGNVIKDFILQNWILTFDYLGLLLFMMFVIVYPVSIPLKALYRLVFPKVIENEQINS